MVALRMCIYSSILMEAQLLIVIKFLSVYFETVCYYLVRKGVNVNILFKWTNVLHLIA